MSAGQDRIAVVTGATRGMGLEASRQLLARGYYVVLTGRQRAPLQAARDSLGAPERCEAFELDVTSAEQAHALAAHLRSLPGRLEVLINNAGAFFEPTDQSAYMQTSVFDMSPDVLRRSLDTNTFGALHVSQALIPLMQAQGYGRVVNVSSGMGALSTMDRGWPAYRISKTALNAVTGLFAAELRGSNIKVNSVCPGWVRTEMGGAGAAKSVEEGVDTTIWLATLPDDGPSGGFYRDRAVAVW
ncbi:MAG: SDR family NAD(P)-dependent oxidoreductase [Rhodocyclaceae bacterium]